MSPGSVKLKLYKGNIITASVTSPESLYSESIVTFEESDYNQTNATGFINLWGLPDSSPGTAGSGQTEIRERTNYSAGRLGAFRSTCKRVS